MCRTILIPDTMSLNNKDFNVMSNAEFFSFLKVVVTSVHFVILGFIVLSGSIDCK